MRKKSGLPAVFSIIIIAIVLIAGVSLANYIAQFPFQAKMLYGPPSVHLNMVQRYTIAYELVQNKEVLFNPAPRLQTEFIFTIEGGEAASSILQRLESVGAISSADLMRSYIYYTGMDTKLQAGSFKLSPTMSQVEVIEALMNANPLYVPFAIYPGWRLEEIASSLPHTGLTITPEEFLAAANQRYGGMPLMDQIPVEASMEGFLPPGIYEVERTITAEQLVRFLLEEFGEWLPRDIREGLEQQGLTLYEGVILASIIQREAVLDEEMPIIASVFYNRLNIAMKLETDPTVQYALGYNSAQTTWWTNPLNYEDLQVDSPYNTYLYPGLPPTPIASPSLAALQAVAFPAQTPYYFFRAACDGSGRHNFSQTYQEHLDFACP